MVFSSLIFLFLFLPLVLILYYISPKGIKNIILLIFSLIFYAWGEPVYILLMVVSTLVDYINGLLIEKYKLKSKFKAKLVLIFSMTFSLCILTFFKYIDFLILNFNTVTGLSLNTLELALPIGLSFYTFQTMSYIIDVYRGDIKAQKNLINFVMYVSFFPQLVAGPIVRYQDIETEIESRSFNKEQFSDGVKLFILGLSKKVLIANNIGLLWNLTEMKDVSSLSVMSAWLGLFAFSLQIFFDFSGYSDMARGLGKMFGFNFPVNFNYPYISKSVSEFWRRWHITLGVWFRDYVYIPLGGSKQGKKKLYINILIVWSLTGLWHGASWNFVLWGLYFGIIILFEKLFLSKFLEKLPRIFQHFYLLFLILLGWLLFVFEDLDKLYNYFLVLFGFTDVSLVDNTFLLDFRNNFVIILFGVICSTPLLEKIYLKFKSKNIVIFDILELIFYIILLLLSVSYLINESYNPFLYFKF